MGALDESEHQERSDAGRRRYRQPGRKERDSENGIEQRFNEWEERGMVRDRYAGEPTVELFAECDWVGEVSRSDQVIDEWPFSAWCVLSTCLKWMVFTSA